MDPAPAPLARLESQVRQLTDAVEDLIRRIEAKPDPVGQVPTSTLVEVYGWSPKTIQRLIGQGLLTPMKRPGQRGHRFDLDEVERVAKGCPVGGVPQRPAPRRRPR